jgi:hypothetical protein
MPQSNRSSPPRQHAIAPRPSALTIRKYGRFWGAYDQTTLVVVTVYRKGALEVVRRLEALHQVTA